LAWLASRRLDGYHSNMQLAAQQDAVSVDDYLAGEEGSEIKHEYIGGAVYAMAGASKEHNQIAGNIYATLLDALRGGRCRVFISDLKVRLKLMGDDVFYYPDVVAGCDPRDTHRHFLRFPKLIIEVSSKATERLDRREKRWSYQSLDTLEEYLMVAQDRVEVTLFRRANDWRPEVFTKLSQKIKLKSLKLTLPVSDVYERVAVG
jgi:Uma2 family endonuclease